jgi:methyl-accepting chemotaxis protein
MSECRCTSCQLDRIINLLTEQGMKIMALEQDLQAVLVQLNKGLGEILGKLTSLGETIVTLQASVDANSEASQQLASAADEVESLKQVAQALDDVVPDAEPEPESPPA